MQYFASYILSIGMCCCLFLHTSKAQELPVVNENTINKLAQHANKQTEQLTNHAKKYIKQLEKQERKFAKKLAKKDSLLAKQYLESINDTYSAFEQKLNKITNQKLDRIKEYYANIDSTTTMLQFITENESFKKGTQYINKAKSTLQQYNTLQQQIRNATDIKEIVKARKQQLYDIANKHNLTKHLSKYNKQAYYYSAQIAEYKQAIKDPAKAEQLILQAARKIPAFKDFFAKFSQMGQLFPQPPNGTLTMASLAGLQTRAQLQTQIQTIAQQMSNSSGGGTNGINMIQQNIQAAQTQINNLRNRVQQAGGNSSDFEIPNFTPNTQKTKSFLKRIELKTDLQTVKGNNYFPNMADIALGLGYKLGDNKNIGIAAAYKFGMGTGWNNINFTSQGLGFRSFADIKFTKKKNIWFTAGYERNYFSSANLTNYTGPGLWNEVAVAGISKKAQISKKRKAEFKILYNFLWKNQPGAQQFIYRTGINF
jgi:hypothetical protein